MARLHLLVGAFLAGQFVRKEIMDEKICYAISDRFFGISYGFLMLVFFASLAFYFHFVRDWHFLLFAAAITVAPVAGKFVGSGLSARLCGHTPREAVVIGYGMNGRGAVELVVAAVVIELSNDLLAGEVITEPLPTQEQFSALVLMAFIATLITPILLKNSVSKSCMGDEKEAFCKLWELSNQKKIK